MSESESFCCPECDSSDVQGHEEEAMDAIGVLQCQCCGFSGLSDEFQSDADNNPF